MHAGLQAAVRCKLYRKCSPKSLSDLDTVRYCIEIKPHAKRLGSDEAP